MPVRFDSTQFGEVVIGGQSFGDVLVVGGKIIERDKSRLFQEFGTDHLISEAEVEKLLEDGPEVVVVGTGHPGLLRVSENIKEKFENAGVELKVYPSTQAISEYNALKEQGKRVNALIHTTC